MPTQPRPMSWEDARDAGERSARINRIEREIDEDSGARGGRSPSQAERRAAIEEALRQEEKEIDEDERRRD